MAKHLLYTWDVGPVRCTHAGFAVCKLRKKTRPSEVFFRFETAEKAVETAERLGDDYGAFRVYEAKGEVSPLERINRDDLPVAVSLKLTDPQDGARKR